MLIDVLNHLEEIRRYSCHTNINNLQKRQKYFNTDWQFGMFKRGKDHGHDT